MELTLSATPLVALGALFFTYLLLQLISYWNFRRRVNKIPGPYSYPFLGNPTMLRIKSAPDAFRWIKDLHNEFRPHGLYQTWNGVRATVFLIRPDYIEAVLGHMRHLNKADGYMQFIKKWLGEGLLISSGAKWRSRRKLLTPTFHFKILNNFFDVFVSQAQHLAEKLGEREEGEVFNIHPIVSRCTLDAICETAMGKHVHAQDSDSKYVKQVYSFGDLISTRGRRPWLYYDFIYNMTRAGRDFFNLIADLQAFTKGVIDDRIEKLKDEPGAGEGDVRLSESSVLELVSRSEKTRPFMDLLLSARRAERLSYEDIREEVDTFMFEGHDTTASAC